MLLKLLSTLPFGFWYLFADFLAWLAGKVFRYRRDVVVENLSRAFPELAGAERQAAADAFYHNLAQVIVETLKARSMSRAAFQQRISIRNPEIFRAYFAQGKSIIALASHQCNWEWVLLGFRAHFEEAMFPVYQPLTNAYFDRLMKKIRSRFGGTAIPMQQTLRQVIGNRKIRAAYGLVADQVPMQQSDKCWLPFLNQDTAFYNGPAKIAQKMGYPAIFIEMRRIKRGYYELILTDLGIPEQGQPTCQTTERYAQLLEQSLKRHKSDWLWSHKRWKHKRPS